MSANVETMFYTREKPWHGLGTRVEQALCSSEALAAAELNWNVLQKELRTEDGLIVAGFKANVRDLDYRVLGVVTDRYKVVQNEKAFAFTDELLGEGITYETAGSLQEGRRTWLLAKLPKRYIISGDEIAPYLVFMNSFDIAVLILGRDFKYAKLEWDNEIIQNLIAVESAFWNKHVIPKCLTDLDGTKASEEVLEKYFCISKKGSEIPLVGFDNKLQRRQELIRLIDKLDVEKSQIEQEVKLFMKENESAASERFRVSWSEVCRKQLDSGRLKTENPMVYEDYLKVTSSRRFYVKAV